VNEQPAGRYDAGERRQAKRSGRERGCWTYIPAEELRKAGIDPGGPIPFYRVWGSSRGSLVIRLYKTYRPPALPGREPTQTEEAHP
jgi:hypothetical protein